MLFLGTSYGLAFGIVVDTHVARLSQRLDFTRQTDPVKIEQDLSQNHSKRSLDSVLAPDDFARSGALPCQEPTMR